MKRIINSIVAATFLLIISLLTSCGHFHDDPTKSVWSGGLIVIPILIAIGFVICAYKAWRAYNSGTIEGGGLTKDGRDLGPVHDVTGPNGEKIHPPMYNNGWMWFAIILFVSFWVVVYIVNNSK